MPTPAPHVPVVFLKAGGAAFFSAQCLALLAEYGYEPEDFGTYDSVATRLRTARARVEAYDAWKAGPQTSPAPPAPTPRERELGAPNSDPVNAYQSGHLGMNSCMQRVRENACTNYVWGHDIDLYPCMPHQGSAEVAGTEHNRWTVREVDTPLGRDGARPRKPYTGDINADADERTRALLRERGRRPQPTATAVAAGAGPAGAAPTAAPTATDATAPTGGGNADTGMKTEDRITGSDAAECINNFRRGGEAGLRAHAQNPETIAHNRRVAGTQAERDAAAQRAQEARGRVAQAERQRDDANGSVAGHTTALNNRIAAAAGVSPDARRAANDAGQPLDLNSYARVPTRDQAAGIAESQRNLAEARERQRLANENLEAVTRANAPIVGEHTRRQNANCMAEQGQWLRDRASGEPGPHNPERWDDLPREGPPGLPEVSA